MYKIYTPKKLTCPKFIILLKEAYLSEASFLVSLCICVHVSNFQQCTVYIMYLTGAGMTWNLSKRRHFSTASGTPSSSTTRGSNRTASAFPFLTWKHQWRERRKGRCFWHVFTITLAFLDHFWGDDMFRLSCFVRKFRSSRVILWYTFHLSIHPLVHLSWSSTHPSQKSGEIWRSFLLSLEYLQGKWVSQSSS